MNTLHKLFLKKYLLDWSKSLGIGVIVALVLLVFGDALPSFFIGIGALSLIFYPFGFAVFTHNLFHENLSWLINYNFNRSQLIKFYFYIQTIKLVLSFVMFGIFMTILFGGSFLMNGSSHQSKMQSEIAGIFNFDFSWGNLGVIYMLFVALVYCIYFASLFKSNWEEVRRRQIKTQMNIQFFYQDPKYWQQFAVGFVVFILTMKFFAKAETFGFILFLSTAVGFFSTVIFNRKFKIFTPKVEKIYATACAAIIVLPNIFIFIGSISDVENSKLNIQRRTSSLSYAEGLYSPNPAVYSDLYSRLDKCSDFYYLAGSASDSDISMKYFFRDDIEFCAFKSTLSAYNRNNGASKYLNDTIHLTKQYIIKNAISEEKQMILGLDFYRIKANRRQIYSLVEGNSLIEKFVGLRLAKSNLGIRKYKTLVNTYYDKLPANLKKLDSVKRAIASQADSTDSNGKKRKYKFNYDHY